MGREGNKKERALKVEEIKLKHKLNLFNTQYRVFLTNEGFIVVFEGILYFDKYTAYYVDKDYNEKFISEFYKQNEYENIFKEIEKFRFEVEGEMR